MRILGTGAVVPEKNLSNEDLSKIVQTSDDWIVSRTGILNRRVCTNETMTYLCVESSLLALENAKTNVKEIDFIICATLSGDYISPSQASLVQSAIGASCPAFDLNAACSGFIYALDVAQSYIDSKRAKKILVIAYDTLSKFTDWSDRSTCVLFGDGGGAVIVGEGQELLGTNLTSEGNAGILNIPLHDESPFKKEKSENQFLQMNGGEVFKFAVGEIVSQTEKLLKECNIKKEELDFVLLHQANLRIINAAVNRLGIPKKKFLFNLDKYGNTSAGSIPLLLDESNRGGLLKKNCLIAMVAFGGGLTTGACITRWNPA